ncbi:uncharacterized protein KQ657_000039 [Scheffersomyces spartinae]|uniref:1,3-beta-glucanosyltransferase n=1 Tax=Scheffersomyces spartinae TaxID=45513 RepID=A0A9P7VEZ9_9ASCO|nr:uncharacterized protein KQ657_000039 [Scheffersomyces spartinae]KAG7196031.1 hypothetical protein KQ657_000039 [Scheffersomyces spartinae]
MNLIFSVFTILLSGYLTQASTSPLVVVGNKFHDLSNGNQFFFKGIAYQAQRSRNAPYDRTTETPYIDNLANATVCMRDLTNLKELGVNIIRVYQIDPTKNHDYCMKVLSEAGVYVIADLAEPNMSIDRNNPFWDVDIFDRYKVVIDSMHKYDNVAGFLVGNEVANSKLTTSSAPFVKAAVRDTKQYIKQKGYRRIPIGYASNDDAEIRNHLANYFVCTDGEEVGTADFYGINIYEWCGYSSYQTSGYRERTAEFQNFPVPIFFSEFGCNTVSPRPFTEIEALLSPPMTKVFSGGIAYEYFNYENNYGVVQETGTGDVVKLTDFEYLKNRYVSIDPEGIHIELSRNQTTNGGGDNHNAYSPIQCFRSTPFWKVSSLTPPTPNYNKCECLQASFSCILSPYTTCNEQELIREICTEIDCGEIEVDGAKGVYGKFSDCSLKQRASHALNLYYNKHNEDPERCDFNGRAILITNSDEKDLESIHALNGLKCLEILGGDSPISNVRHEVAGGNNKVGQVSGINSNRFNQTTKLMLSEGSRLHRMAHLILLAQAANYIHI